MPIGSILGGIIASGGAANAAGLDQSAGNTALANAAFTNAGNSSAASPYTQLGSGAAGTLGSLLGFGTLTGNPNGQGSTFVNDGTNTSQIGALNQINALARGSGAVQPTLTNQTFTPVTAVNSTFQADPSYAWRLSQGEGAINNSGAANGLGKSGAQMQALDAYGQNAASQEYQNWFARYMNQNAYNLQGQAGVNAANFGQQQQEFANTQGQFNNATGLLTGAVGTGNSANSALGGQTAGLTANGNNVFAGTSTAAGNELANSSNALAAGISGGVNSLASLASYGLGGGFSGLGGSSGLPGTGAAAANAAAQYGPAPASY